MFHNVWNRQNVVNSSENFEKLSKKVDLTFRSDLVAESFF